MFLALSDSLALEISRAITTENALSSNYATINNALSTEISTRTAAILREENARVNNITSLTMNILSNYATINNSLSAAILTSNASITSETIRAMTAENVLSSNFSTINNALNTEISTRTAAILQEATTRVNNITALAINISSEALARTNMDIILAANISYLASTSTLSTNLSTNLSLLASQTATAISNLNTTLFTYFYNLLSCNVPPSINFGSVSSCYSSYIGATCTPVCNPGYFISGFFMCTPGAWQGTPKCTPLPCFASSLPSTIPNSNVAVCNGTLHNTTCNPCLAGFVPSVLYTCSYGNWSSSVPTCCPDPATPANHGSQLFAASGIFNLPLGYGPSCALPISLVMIGGGGSGGAEWGEGGSSGFLHVGSTTLSNGGVAVTVGSGGGFTANPGNGNSGNPSTFLAYTAAGGLYGNGNNVCSDPRGVTGWSGAGGACMPQCMIYLYMYMYMYMYVYIYMCVCVCVYIYIFIIVFV